MKTNITSGKVLVGGKPAPGIALHGYHAVAYFDGGTPRMGDADIALVHDDATYRFSSKAHLDKFVAKPESYIPVQVPDHKEAARFHLVIQGRCNVSFASGQQVDLQAGDLILIPKGRAHVLADSAGRSAAPLEQAIKNSGYTGAGIFVLGEENLAASTQMVCGHFSFRDGADHPLLQALPEFIVISAATRARVPLLGEVLHLIKRKMPANDLGTAAALVRLSEIVFIELLNVEISGSPEFARITSALIDKKIGRALSLIHAEPGRAWTVEVLARELGMSRSSFSDRFRDLVGCGAITYVADWRLQKALAMLDGSNWSVREIATRSGYQSPAAFTRAFAAKFGISPTKYRLAGLQPTKTRESRQA
jgi:AraC family transcriptional regulator, activator of mtrCDE